MKGEKKGNKMFPFEVWPAKLKIRKKKKRLRSRTKNVYLKIKNPLSPIL